MKRRKFIQNASTAMVGSMMLPSLMSCAKTSDTPIGIQLYTLKDIIGRDVPGTLKKVAEIGFKELELFGHMNGKVFNMPYADFNKLANDLGLSIVSGHYRTGRERPDNKGTLINNWDVAVDEAHRAGQKYMIIAYLESFERKTLDDYKAVCDLMNKANEVCKSAGITLGYHNHEFEFVPVEGKVPYDVLAEGFDSSIVLELDIYWSTFAKVDASELFKKYSGRIPLWHVKDMNKEKREQQTDVGSGSIDYKSVYQQKSVSGLKHLFLEQEYFAGSQIDSITNGYKHLRGFV